MATYLEVTNGVLTRLRRGTVLDVDDSKAELIAKLVNVAKREVEDSFRWNALRTSLDLAVVQSDNDYSLTNFGERFIVERVWDVTNEIILFQTDHVWLEKQRVFGNSQEQQPVYWAISGVDSNGDPVIELYPTPEAARTVRVWGHVPQVDLTTSSEQIKVPSLPIELKAYSLALEERGEDGGTISTMADREFNRALDNAIERENQAQSKGHKTDWHVAYGPTA